MEWLRLVYEIMINVYYIQCKYTYTHKYYSYYSKYGKDVWFRGENTMLSLNFLKKRYM